MIRPLDRVIVSRIAIGATLCVALVFTHCSSSVPGPASLDTRNDTCAHCRMAVSDERFAAQLVAPGEEPKFFDDIGCLREFLEAAPTLPPGSVAYVASHRTKAWIPARDAFYVRGEKIETPMGFGVIAFESAHAREGSFAATGGERLDAAAVFGNRLPSPEAR
jgi:copper chaperone NosL